MPSESSRARRAGGCTRARPLPAPVRDRPPGAPPPSEERAGRFGRRRPVGSEHPQRTLPRRGSRRRRRRARRAERADRGGGAHLPPARRPSRDVARKRVRRSSGGVSVRRCDRARLQHAHGRASTIATAIISNAAARSRHGGATRGGMSSTGSIGNRIWAIRIATPPPMNSRRGAAGREIRARTVQRDDAESTAEMAACVLWIEDAPAAVASARRRRLRRRSAAGRGRRA